MLVLLAMVTLLATPVWCVAIVVKLVSLALPGRRPGRARQLRWFAAMTAAGALGLYLMAAGAVAYNVHDTRSGADSSPAHACRDGFPRDTVEHLVGHRASYVPPRFDCVRDDGTTYPSSGTYAWWNLLTVGFAVVAAGLAAAARYVRARRPSAQARDSGPSEAPVGGTSGTAGAQGSGARESGT
ncbi:hypothetical protein JCM4814A_87060 [Streptomyces phaeofaciens JCM 4814]|uniref:Uncharacterized protein n=1 Tax=Streptomyces phaeofaciens TaxID=68254 RepID=A0A918LT34_9ACTN|nr:hypothetical protein [Streptomyces phaeofaciens]GGT45352.1 hypothetical protein GCM10010226_22640 [Streptomyces phaeofaciens]